MTDLHTSLFSSFSNPPFHFIINFNLLDIQKFFFTIFTVDFFSGPWTWITADVLVPYDIIISYWHVRSQAKYARYGRLVSIRHAGKQGNGKSDPGWGNLSTKLEVMQYIFLNYYCNTIPCVWLGTDDYISGVVRH